MGITKQTPCQSCTAPAYGTHCRNCSLARLRSRKAAKRSVNSVGEWNAGHASGIAFIKVAPTVGPWWIGAPQDGFTHIGEQHAERMSRGCAASFIRADAFLAWTL